ncbi:hypothetical protein LB505_009690 [Fusarium chuoi]|nr:hypothetical protein LB505_009690 [Fusarium chuoi]
MILGPISLVDCGVFLIFLAPQLIWHAGFFLTLFTGLRALPFLRSCDTLCALCLRQYPRQGWASILRQTCCVTIYSLAHASPWLCQISSSLQGIPHRKSWSHFSLWL